jgi:hypothetical protein
MTKHSDLLRPVLVGLMACGLFGGCQDDPGAPVAPSGSGGDAGSGGAVGDAGFGGDAGTITCDPGGVSGVAGEAGSEGRAEPFACKRSDATPGAVCCPSSRAPCGQALCRPVSDLASCCFTESCGWVGSYDEELYSGCINDQVSNFGYVYNPPPSYPSGVLCMVPDPDGRSPFCAADGACPADIPRAGAECSDVAGRCHYCNPPSEPIGPYSRTFACTDGVWIDLGASACGQHIGGTPERDHAYHGPRNRRTDSRSDLLSAK